MFCSFGIGGSGSSSGFGVPIRASPISQDHPFKEFSLQRRGKTANKSTSSSLGSRNWVLRVGKLIVFGGKMGMRKF